MFNLASPRQLDSLTLNLCSLLCFQVNPVKMSPNLIGIYFSCFGIFS